MATVDAQVLGYNATDYIMTTTKRQMAINAVAANEAVTIGTLSWIGHRMTASTPTTPTRSSATTRPPARSPCTIPGDRSAGPAHLEPAPGDCSQIAVCDTSQVQVPIISGAVAAACNKTSSGRILDIAGESPFQSAATAVAPRRSAGVWRVVGRAHALRKVFGRWTVMLPSSGIGRTLPAPSRSGRPGDGDPGRRHAAGRRSVVAGRGFGGPRVETNQSAPCRRTAAAPRERDRAVGLLVVFQDGDQRAADGDGRAVERVDEDACPSRPSA